MAPISYAFNGAMLHETLISLPQYPANQEEFLKIADWNHTGLLTVKKTPDTPLELIIVGVVSPVEAVLDTHGTYGQYSAPRDPKKEAVRAKNTFVVRKPNEDEQPELAADWHVAISTIKLIQNRVAKNRDKEDKQKHFLTEHKIPGQDVIQTLKFNWTIFEKKPTFVSSRPEVRKMNEKREIISTEYTVDPTYASVFDDLKARHWATPIPIYLHDSTEPMTPAEYQEILVGSLVEVAFTLNWYQFKDKDEDTFTARVKRVTILEEGANPSSVVTPRPRHAPQTPTRGEHVNAARAFVPKTPTLTKIPQPNFGVADATPAATANTQASPSKLMNSLHLQGDDNGASSASSSTLSSSSQSSNEVETSLRAREEDEEQASPTKRQKRTHDEIEGR